jgi:peptidoglycan/xylan/chitin deacetylase (PgdA/CDA1 family)
MAQQVHRVEAPGAAPVISPCLLYHDVVPAGEWDSSGFAGPGADLYKLDERDFRRHLEAIDRRGVGARDRLFTFDDGGRSALEPTARLLEEFGWRGWFFIPTDFIGTPGFLTGAEIRRLRERGHVVGSHSCSHPARMARCSRAHLVREWSESRQRLADILGESVDCASVPGGYYARAVAEAAAQCGIGLLFTSEPTTRIRRVNGTEVVGRYAVQRGIGAETAAAIASGERAPRLKQAALWTAKKAVKRIGGRHWLRLRRYLLARRVR